MSRTWGAVVGKALKRTLWRKIGIFGAVLVFGACLFSDHSFGAGQADFQQWLEGVRQEALGEGVSKAVLDRAFHRLKPIPRVIELDRSQPEFKLTLDQYLKRVVTDKTVWDGQQLYREHRNLLEKLSRQYGVPPQYIVALWGIETRYGRVTGGYPVIAALATLAYDGRRSAFFRKELIRALKILEEGHIAVEDMDGSWAGAMGQVQFMPSSFVTYAVDHDGDGRIDIWDNVNDALASAANYLSRSGWRRNEGWGGEVTLPKGFDFREISGEIKKSLSQWKKMGLMGKGVKGDPDCEAYLVQPDKKEDRFYLAYANYQVILKWNRSNYFAVAVGTLADRISSGNP